MISQASSIIVYTAVTDGYDNGKLKLVPEDDVHAETRIPPVGIKGREATLWNREQKLVWPPRNGMASVYLDGSFTPKMQWRESVEKWLDQADIALFKHPWRTCAYAEIDECVKRGKITADEGQKARSHLMLAGFPRDFGLWALGMVARRTHANAIQKFAMVMVWTMCREVPRDQIWFPFVIWKMRHSLKRVHTIDKDIYNNKLLSFRRHGT